MSARALPGSLVDAKRAGMMAMTDAEAVSRVETGLETGCTTNLTTTARYRMRLEQRCSCGVVLLMARAEVSERKTGLRTTHMTVRRAVVYGGTCCLLAAWLASAASTTRRPPVTYQEPSATGTAATETLASEVEAHAARLRERLATAPRPQLPHRNPFVFESRPSVPQRPVALRADPASVPEPLPPPEPTLSLIGITEDQGPKGLVRTAIITGDADAVFVLAVGETVLDRYTVEAIGADAVELKEIATNAVRRLALR